MSSPTLEQLKQDLGQLTAALTALTRPRAAQEVTDETGHVSVDLDERGRITAVRIGNRWKEDIPPEALGATILSIPLQASLRSSIAALDQGNDAPAEPVDVPSRRYEFDSTTAADLDEKIGSLRRRNEAWAGRPVEQRYEELPAPEGDEPRSENGKVVVTLAAGGVREILIDQRWLERVATQSVSDSVTEALTRAYERLDENPAASTGGRRLDAEGRELREDADAVLDLIESHRRQW